MIQGNLTKLDNDFITIWSHYMLYREIDKEALRKLAEMGQINAVQSYYLFFDRRNKKVDEIVYGYTGINPDELFAQANKLFFDRRGDRKRLKELVTEISDLKDEIERLEYEYASSQSPKIEQEFNRKIAERKTLETEFYNTPYIKQKKTSISEYWNIGVQTKNPLFGERAVELQVSMPFANIPDLKRCIKKTRKGLIKAYKKDKEDVAVQFALGKNLVMFKASAKEKELANLLLKNLSRRELSQEVQSYNENYMINESIDEEDLPSIEDEY